jgi:hypothetical protein
LLQLIAATRTEEAAQRCALQRRFFHALMRNLMVPVVGLEITVILQIAA